MNLTRLKPNFRNEVIKAMEQKPASLHLQIGNQLGASSGSLELVESICRCPLRLALGAGSELLEPPYTLPHAQPPGSPPMSAPRENCRNRTIPGSELGWR